MLPLLRSVNILIIKRMCTVCVCLLIKIFPKELWDRKPVINKYYTV